MTVPVSVVIPAQGREKLLVRAIESVFAQTIPVEIVVVDDASESPLEHCLSANALSGIKLFRNHECMNAAASRNRGVSVATGDVIAFLDSDDEWMPDHLEKAVTDTSFSTMLIHITPLKARLPRPKIINDPYGFLFGSGGDYRTSGIVVGKSVFGMVGGFDDKLSKHQDWDFVLRASQHCVLRLGHEVTVRVDIAAPGRMSASPDLEASQRFFDRHKANMTESQRLVFFSGVFRACVYSRDFVALDRATRWAGEHIRLTDLDMGTRFCGQFPRIGATLMRGRQALRRMKMR